jgi:hypothetical protein
VDGVTPRPQHFGCRIVESDADLVGAWLSRLDEPDGAFVEFELWVVIVVHHHAITSSQGVPLEQEHHRTSALACRPIGHPACRVVGS